MMGQSTRLQVCAIMGFLTTSSQSFCPSSVPRTSRPIFPLHLCPEQGTQLVAASCASLVEPGLKVDPEDGTGTGGTLQATRKILSEIFRNSAGPSSSGEARPHTSRFGRLMDLIHHEEDEGVLYPVVGFRWVKMEDSSDGGKSKSYFVTPERKTACAIHPSSLKEEPYGWFSPVCYLED